MIHLHLNLFLQTYKRINLNLSASFNKIAANMWRSVGPPTFLPIRCVQQAVPSTNWQLCCCCAEVIPRVSLREQLPLAAPLLLLLSWWGTFPPSHFLPQDPLFMTGCVFVCAHECVYNILCTYLMWARRPLKVWFKLNVPSQLALRMPKRVLRHVHIFLILHIHGYPPQWHIPATASQTSHQCFYGIRSIFFSLFAHPVSNIVISCVVFLHNSCVSILLPQFPPQIKLFHWKDQKWQIPCACMFWWVWPTVWGWMESWF